MRAFFPVLVLVLTSSAYAFVPQIASTKDTVCLLTAGSTGKGEIHCWNFYGQRISAPRFREVSQIAATPTRFCALVSGRLRCWGEARGSDLRNLSAIEKIGGGDSGICVFDAKEKLKCDIERPYYSSDYYSNEIHDPKLPMVNSATEIAVDGQVGCVLTNEDEIACWGGFLQEQENHDLERTVVSINPASEQAMQKVPTGFKLPHSLTVSLDATGCVLDGNQVRCWGAQPEMAEAVQKVPAGIASVRLDSYFPSILTWSESGKLNSIPFSKDPVSRERDLGGLGEPLLFDHHCAASATEIFCGQYPFLHDLDLGSREFPLFEKLLERAARNIYADKKKIVTTAERLLSGAPQDQRRFLFLSLAPLFELTDSAYISQSLRTIYQEQRGAVPGLVLARIAKIPEISRTALELLHASLPSGETGADRDLLTAIGQALASPGDSRALHAVGEAYRHHQAEWDALQALPKHQAPAALIRMLVQYLDS